MLGPNCKMCSLSPGSFIPLTLTSCPEESYTCDYGTCIPLANKCNSKIDCWDESDEGSCQYLEVTARNLEQESHIGYRYHPTMPDNLVHAQEDPMEFQCTSTFQSLHFPELIQFYCNSQLTIISISDGRYFLFIF